MQQVGIQGAAPAFGREENGSPCTTNVLYGNPALNNDRVSGAFTEREPILDTDTTTDVYTNTIHIHIHRDRPVGIRVVGANWDAFKKKAYSAGYSANELLNIFIEAFANGTMFRPEQRTAIFNMNMNIAKAEAYSTTDVRRLADEQIAKKLIFRARQLEESLKTNPHNASSRSSELEDRFHAFMAKNPKLTPEVIAELQAALAVIAARRAGGKA